MSKFYETTLAVQIIFFKLQNNFEIRENKSKTRCEIYSKLTLINSRIRYKTSLLRFPLKFSIDIFLLVLSLWASGEQLKKIQVLPIL